MERKLPLILALSASLALVTACSSDTDVGSTPAPPSTSPATTSAVVEENPTVRAIKETFSDFSDPDYVNVSSALGMTTVDLFDPDWASSIATSKAAGTAPTDWEAQKSTLTTLTTDLPLLPDTSRAAVYVRSSEDGEIYLTVAGGSILFDVFEEAATYNADTISLDEFNQITTGMSYDEVVAIIGSKGELLSEADIGLGSEYVTSIWMWEGEGSLGANANVTFQDGGVVAKAQFGLE